MKKRLEHAISDSSSLFVQLYHQLLSPTNVNSPALMDPFYITPLLLGNGFLSGIASLSREHFLSHSKLVDVLCFVGPFQLRIGVHFADRRPRKDCECRHGILVSWSRRNEKVKAI